jgi:hypothetical protein
MVEMEYDGPFGESNSQEQVTKKGDHIERPRANYAEGGWHCGFIAIRVIVALGGGDV